MELLNYNHLAYFWVVGREGSVAAAARRLGVAQPTISAQLRALERRLGQKLFTRAGRGLALTDAGQVVYRYADEIFSLGQELQDTLAGRPTHAQLRLNVGVTDVIPKLVAHRLLAPAFELPEAIRIVCTEDKPRELLARLSVHQIDVVLSDVPIIPEVHVSAFNHLLGDSPVALFGVRKLARKYRRGFPGSLNGAPLLMPTPSATIRRALEQWLDRVGVRPLVVGEFEDSALIKTFGQHGAGLFAGPTVIADEIRAQYGVELVGEIDTVRETFYLISVERRVSHPAVLAILENARKRLFSA